MSKVINTIERRSSIPIIYVRGSHYEIGFDVGRTFRAMIQEYVCIHKPLNEIYLPLYEKPEGKRAYDETLETVTKSFPQYIEEIRGTAEGANIPFHKLFLLHMDEILPNSVEKKNLENCSGCSTVCCNHRGQEFLGHNEDALAETVNHFYFVSAHVIENEPKGKYKVREEKFVSLCYAGMLPGFTMSYNNHGLVYTVNLIRVQKMHAAKIPRTILTRALLGAENISKAEEILTDQGVGIGDGVSINMIFLKEGNKIFYNVEVGPSDSPNTGSAVDIIAANAGENIYHCNSYLRLKCQQPNDRLMVSSKHRQAIMNILPHPECELDIATILGDISDKDYPVFRDEGETVTILTGIFNLSKLTWILYIGNPKNSGPVCELPISF